MKKETIKDSICYAVIMGREPGIYYSWDEVLRVTKGFLGASVKKCYSLSEAQELLGEKQLKGFRLAEERQTNKLSHLHMMNIYTDGSFNGRTNDYSYAFVTVKHESVTHSQSGLGTNKEAALSLKSLAGELKAVMEAVRYAALNGERNLVIYHDFNGVREIVTREIKPRNPFAKQYKTFMDRWIALYGLRLDFTKVKAHNGNEYNELVDHLAKEALFRTKISSTNNALEMPHIVELRKKALKVNKTIDCFSGKGKVRQKLLSSGENIYLSYRHNYLSYADLMDDIEFLVDVFIEKAKWKQLVLSRDQAYLFFLSHSLKMENIYMKLIRNKKVRKEIKVSKENNHLKGLMVKAITIKSPLNCFTVDEKDKQRMVSYGHAIFKRKRESFSSLSALMINVGSMVRELLKRAHDQQIAVNEEQCYLFFLSYSEKMEKFYQKKLKRQLSMG
ncbi:ribonuclease H family protein [Guptibacillus spartinae]|uniref:ribonuclease H family protein n=1 Tax=Guptibacillus spartinae TaxID=3025679 RepID=UPI00235F3B3E|nr:ribonuclease H family protein [Pseudalkalibacillus spartinae]